VKSAFKSLILKYYKCLWYCSKHNIWNLSNLLLSRKTWEIVDKYYSDKFNFPSRALIVVQCCYVCKGWVTLKATVKAEYEATNNCLNSVHQQKVTAFLHFRPACHNLWWYLHEKTYWRLGWGCKTYSNSSIRDSKRKGVLLCFSKGNKLFKQKIRLRLQTKKRFIETNWHMPGPPWSSLMVTTWLVQKSILQAACTFTNKLKIGII